MPLSVGRWFKSSRGACKALDKARAFFIVVKTHVHSIFFPAALFNVGYSNSTQPIWKLIKSIAF
jgi:hypothetical protein